MGYAVMLVDDEEPAVEAMCAGIGWKKLQFETVYTAFNASQARRILESHEVDLIICDIEMPQEDGLSMIEWVQRQYPQIVSILLTCHADFSYARRSVKARVYDYILKPTPYAEIEDILLKATEVIKDQKDIIKRREYEEILQNNKLIIQSRFFQDLLSGQMGEDRAVICREAGRWGLTIDPDQEYILLLCGIRNEKEAEKGSSMIQVLTSFLSTKLNMDQNMIQSLSFRTNETLVVFTSTLSGKEEKVLREGLTTFLEELTHFEKKKPCIYCSLPRKLELLSRSYACIEEMKRKNVAYDGAVYFEDDRPKVFCDDMIWDLHGMRELLLGGNEEKLYSTLENLLRKDIEEGSLSEDKLLMFYHHFIQMVYAALSEKQISVKAIFEKEDIRDRYREKFDTVEELLGYLNSVIHASCALLLQSFNKGSIMEKVEEYIAQHICEDLSRDQIADYVFLNAEYLSRIFRKEKGIALKEYITEQKLRKAKEMFLTTNLSVTEVACQIGYTNLPYFSKLFKENTGMTPNEYRKSFHTL